MLRKSSIVITVVPDIIAAAYASGDVIGTPQVVTNAVLSQGGTGKLTSLMIADKANAKVALDILFFDSAPATSIGADNAAYALADADTPKLLGRVAIAGADYVSSGTANAEATIKNIGLILQAASGSKNIYMAVICRGAPTYASVSDLQIRLGIEQD